MPDYDYEPPFEVGYPEEPPPPFEEGYPEPQPDPGNPFVPPPLPGDSGDNPVEGIPGPGGEPPGETGDQFDWGAFLKNPAEYLTKIFGSPKNSAGIPWGEVLKSLGLTSSGGLSVTDLIKIAGLAAGTGIQLNQTKEASEAIKNAAAGANARIDKALEAANANYAPYNAAGIEAIKKWSSSSPEMLAGKFTAQGTPSNAASQFRGAMSLADLIKRK